MPLSYLLHRLWEWLATTGVNLALIVVLAFLVPRVGRFVMRIVAREVTHTQDGNDAKASLALAGVGIYVGQIIGFFVLVIAFLHQVGFSLAGAAIPATVISAAIGFGAQSIIADFLAGFFVLSEKQYGVGDWVRFEGGGVHTEGTVISITMRATKIRTLAEETVSIPNSTARVCINTSNYFSSAVVVMPIPLQGSASATAARDTAARAVHQALEDPEINEHLIGTLAVHPATTVTRPATVGSPWTMDIRFIHQVTAGKQWAVERAMRMALLDAFWDEYSRATTADGSPSTRRTAPNPAPTDTTDSSVTEVVDKRPSPPERTILPEPDDVTPSGTPSTHQAVKESLTQMRGSTGWLIAAGVGLLVLNLLTFSAVDDGGERVSGFLAPPPGTTSQSPAPPDTVSEPNSPEAPAPISEPSSVNDPAASPQPTPPTSVPPTPSTSSTPQNSTTPTGEDTPTSTLEPYDSQ